MADQFIQVPPQSTGLKVDCTELTVGANTVERERINIADPTSATAIAGVTAGGALKTDASATTQPISAASLPLPTGAAQDATLTGGSAVSIIKSGTKGTSTAALVTSNPIDVNTQALHVDGSKVTQPVSGTVTANAGTGTFNSSDAADGSTAATAPVKAIQVGVVGENALPTSVTNGQLVGVMADVAGRLITRNGGPRELLTDNNLTLTAIGNNTLIAAGAVGVFRDLTFLQASNTSTTAVRIDISDGTRIYSWFLAASGGGFNINFNPPLKATTAATAWTAAISASVTDVRVSAQSVDTK